LKSREIEDKEERKGRREFLAGAENYPKAWKILKGKQYQEKTNQTTTTFFPAVADLAPGIVGQRCS